MAKLPTVDELRLMGHQERYMEFKKLPKVELHCHGDLATPVSKLIEAYHAFAPKDENYLSDMDIISGVLCNYKVPTLVDFIQKTRLVAKIYSADIEMLERCTYETIVSKHEDNVVGFEFRFSPPFLAETCGYSYDDSVTQVEAGVERAKKELGDSIEVGLIYIGEAGINDKFPLSESVDYVLGNRHRFIGVDNAGYDLPLLPFKPQYDRLKEAGINLTLHTGETPAYPENNIYYALQCGAQRIGHGIEAHRDPALMELLKKEDIILEICPKSNWVTNAHLKDYSEHPIRKLYDNGVKVCINTDDPLMFANTLSEEYEILFTHLGFGCDDFNKMNTWALEKSFLPPQAKARLKKLHFPEARL